MGLFYYMSNICSNNRYNTTITIKMEEAMEIKKAAVSGTLESSDCMITLEPFENGIEIELESVVFHQFGNQIKKVILETLDNLDIKNIKVHIVDKGALDCTIKARLESAVFRALEQYENIPWNTKIEGGKYE